MKETEAREVFSEILRYIAQYETLNRLEKMQYSDGKQQRYFQVAYLLVLEGTPVTGTGGAHCGGHVIAIYRDAIQTLIFDPNMGEFVFGQHEEAELEAFGRDLWMGYRNIPNIAQRFYRWELARFYDSGQDSFSLTAPVAVGR